MICHILKKAYEFARKAYAATGVDAGKAIELAGPKAVVMMFGLTRPDETIAVKPFTVFQKEIVLKASYINPYTQRRALDLIDSGRLDVTSMVHAVCGLDRLAGILGSPQERSLGKFIIDPSL